MKKLFYLLIPLLLVAGCSFSVDFGTNKAEEAAKQEEQEATQKKQEKAEAEKVNREVDDSDKDNLTVQITKVDEEAGVTIEDSVIYQELEEIVANDPQIGVADDFSMGLIQTLTDGDGAFSLLFFGINRLDSPISNLTFDFTFGHDGGEFLWEDYEIIIDESEFGVIEPNAAFPIFINADKETVDILEDINDENLIFEMENFTFDTN